MSLRHRLKPVFRQYRIFWIIFVLFTLGNILYYSTAIRSAERRSEALRAEYRTRRTALNQVPEVDSAVRQYIQAKQDIQTFRKKLPDGDVAGELTDELNSLLRNNNVDSSPVIFTSQGVDKLFLIRYTAEFSAIAPYSAVKKLLADIQNSPHLFCIESLDLKNRSGDTGQAEIHLKIATWLRVSMRL